jgi:hypothetical protein
MQPGATTNIEIILCVPGKWKDRSELVISLAAMNNDQYIFAGNVLMHIPTNEFFEVEVCDYDHRMKEAFAIAGAGRMNEAELNEIDNHSFVVYIIGKGGDMESAAKMMKAGQAFLNAGGLGIKVETCGKAFNAEAWNAFTNSAIELKYYMAFVILLISTEDNYIYSCGMHNVGLRDTICDYTGDIKDIANLIEVFSVYQLAENPVIKDEQTFSPQADAAVYRIIESECIFYEKEHRFYNPYGMYYLKERE